MLTPMLSQILADYDQVAEAAHDLGTSSLRHMAMLVDVQRSVAADLAIAAHAARGLWEILR